MLSSLNLAPAGSIIIGIIVALFALSVILLITVSMRYRSLHHDISIRGGARSSFAVALKNEYSSAYKQYGKDTNTPAIIGNTISTSLGKELFSERFMNHAVSLLVTIGLFGTFLGLSLSVSSLTELLRNSSSDEWLNVLDSVGSGLFSALSGMGVAFYTSLAGVGCSIVFTLLKAIFNPQAQRESLETAAELWLDHVIAPQCTTDAAHDSESQLMALKQELRAHSSAVQTSLNSCTAEMGQVLADATNSLGAMIEYSKEPLRIFYDTVQTFNENVRDFSAVNYDLRGSIERMDLAVRDFGTAVRAATGRSSSQQTADRSYSRPASPQNGGNDR